MINENLILFFKNVFRTIREGAKYNQSVFFILAACTIFLGIAPVISLKILERLLEYAFKPEVPLAEMIFVVFFWSGFYLLEDSLGELRVYLSSLLNLSLKKRLPKKLVGQMVKVDLEYYNKSEFMSRLKRAREALKGDLFWDFVLDIFYQPIHIIKLISLSIYIAIFDLWALIFLFLLAAAQSAFFLVRSRQRYAYERETTELRRRKNYYFNVFYSRSEARDIRLFKMENFFIQKWQKTVRKLYQKLLNLEKKYFLRFGLLSLFVFFFFFSAFDLSLYQENPEVLITAILGVKMFMDAISSVSAEGGEFYKTGLKLNDYFDLLNFAENQDDERQKQKLPPGVLVKLENVSYKYPGEDNKWALRNIDFTLREKETVAIIGDNGAGKSTLIKIILGLYKPTEGKASYTGGRKVWKKNASAEFQDFIKYELSAGKNVGLGDDLLYNNETEIRRSIKDANAEQIVSQLKNGLDSRLGRLFEDGVELSGGQWQRLGLARACLRDSLAVSLDEPTANLDPNAEARVFQAFLKNKGKRAVLLVAHRIGPARLADRIIVIHNGTIVEQGSHDELIEKEGRYSKLYNAQAKWYY